MTLAEMLLTIDSFKRRKKSAKIESYNNSKMTAIFVSSLLSGKEIPQIFELFDGFEEEEQQYNDQMVQKYLAQFQQFAQLHNQQRREKG